MRSAKCQVRNEEEDECEMRSADCGVRKKGKRNEDGKECEARNAKCEIFNVVI